MNGLVIAVSQLSVFLAESRIVGCSMCSSRATIRFERLLDEVTGRNEQPSYVLPFLATCPSCDAAINETTLVQRRRVTTVRKPTQ
jgi:hypothetical protein